MFSFNPFQPLLDTPWTGLSEFAHRFREIWREQGRQLLQQFIQEKIEQLERDRSGCRKILCRRYHTSLGTIELERRLYDTPVGPVCYADQILNLPDSPWLNEVLELLCGLGANNEFGPAQRLFTDWTGVQVCERTVANQVEAIGEQVYEEEARREPVETAPLDSALALQVQKKPQVLPRLYVGADGIMVPLNQKQGYKEGRVGVIFWERDRWQVSEKRAEIRARQYVATMENRQAFSAHLYQQYSEVAGGQKCETIVLGDGAHWIWTMAEDFYPKSVQILDFFHVSEYVWAVAKARWPEAPLEQEKWVLPQLRLLKESRWREIIDGLGVFETPSPLLKQVVGDLKRYLTNNAERIDYKAYLEKGYMIGSGVVESSNRRIVTQRLKHSGMHWSKRGANAIMALRACYLSNEDRWQSIWKARAVA